MGGSRRWAAVRGYNNRLRHPDGQASPPTRRAHPWFRRGAGLGHISCVWANGVICRDGYAVSGSLNGRDSAIDNGEGVDRAEAER